MTSCVDNPREAGERLIDSDGNDDTQDDGRLSISLRPSPTTTSTLSLDSDGHLVQTRDSANDDNMAPLEVDEDPVSDNPDEAVAPPDASDVRDARLSHFRFGWPVSDYPIPNSAFHDQTLPCIGPRTIDQALRRGGLNDLVKGEFTFLFSEVKLEALLSCLSDSTRS